MGRLRSRDAELAFGDPGRDGKPNRPGAGRGIFLIRSGVFLIRTRAIDTSETRGATSAGGARAYRKSPVGYLTIPAKRAASLLFPSGLK